MSIMVFHSQMGLYSQDELIPEVHFTVITASIMLMILIMEHSNSISQAQFQTVYRNVIIMLTQNVHSFQFLKHSDKQLI